jgi:hypothetical protein
MTTARTRPPDGNGRRQQGLRRRPDAGRRPPEPEPEPGSEPEPADLDAGDALPRLLKGVGAVVAPTTVITGLLLYFGQLHAYAFFWHFGVNFTVLDLTPTDYLVRSADGLFVPIALVAGALLVAVWAQRLVVHRLAAATSFRILHVVAPLAAAVGVLLVGLAVVLIVAGADFRRRFEPETGGIALAVGVLLLVYAVRLARREWNCRQPRDAHRLPGTGLAEWAAAFVLVTVGLFWAVNGYATQVGYGRALQLRDELPAWPVAVLFSERSLSLAAEGVTEVRCEDVDAAYRFRYDGLKLVQQAGGHYLLLPEQWTPAEGSAVLIPRSDSVRLEFALPGVPRAPVC